MNNIKMLSFDRIDVSERTDINNFSLVHQKSVIFVAIGISSTKVLRFNQMSTMHSMIY